jgi:hypothetical protein
MRHIGICGNCASREACDSWSKTGTGRARNAVPRRCQNHEETLLAEADPQLQNLLADLENEVKVVLFRHNGVRAEFYQHLGVAVHRAIVETAAPFLYKYIAASCCPETVFEKPI